ncbi:hypothetical protein FRC09_010229, partial [Ceratobasidium sp. 395]
MPKVDILNVPACRGLCVPPRPGAHQAGPKSLVDFIRTSKIRVPQDQLPRSDSTVLSIESKLFASEAIIDD